uniref:N(6)-adenine-specific DNA methyltransferase 2 n=1 Tax=Ascaris suum TaxID=6253 RepID=F1KZH5_ASCSU
MKYPQQFVSYDYRQPLQVAPEQRGVYELVIVDPPFLSDECIVKVAQSVRLLAKNAANTKVIICTGAVMQNLVERLFFAHRCAFKPTHEKNLANEFACFANYNTQIL